MKIIIALIFFAAMTAMISSCSSSGSQTNTKLEGTRWILTKLNGVPVLTTSGKKEAFITFNSPEKKFTGSGGCNNMFGTYTRSGSSLSIGPVARTEMFCEGVMETEDGFVKALGKNAKYRIKGDVLSLIDSSGVTTANLTAE